MLEICAVEGFGICSGCPGLVTRSCWGYLGLDLEDRDQTVLGKVTLTSSSGTGELGPQGLKDMPVAARLLGWRVSLAEPGVWPCPVCLALCQVMMGAQKGLSQGHDRWKQERLPGGGNAGPGLEG